MPEIEKKDLLLLAHECIRSNSILVITKMFSKFLQSLLIDLRYTLLTLYQGS